MNNGMAGRALPVTDARANFWAGLILSDRTSLQRRVSRDVPDPFRPLSGNAPADEAAGGPHGPGYTRKSASSSGATAFVTASSRASPSRGPASVTPTGRPFGPVAPGMLTQGAWSSVHIVFMT